MAVPDRSPTVDSLKLVIQPYDAETNAYLVNQGFRAIPSIPQLLYLIIGSQQVTDVFWQLSQALSEVSLMTSKFSLTRSPLNAHNLLLGFLQARPLNSVAKFVKYHWFFQALAKQSLFFHYQPIFDLATGKVIAHECLARAAGESNQYFSGQQLIDAALSTQCTSEFDDLARETCIDAIASLNQGQTFFINVLPNAILHDPRSLEHNLQRMQALGLKPQQIMFELTEVEALTQRSELLRLISQLRERGFGIALDDLCSQVSLDHHLIELHPDIIKLDRKLVHGCSQNPVKQILLKTFLHAAHDQGILVLAEGLEMPEDIEFCCDLGVDLGQGFGLALPESTLQKQPLDLTEFFARQDSKKHPLAPSPLGKTVWLPTWRQRFTCAI